MQESPPPAQDKKTKAKKPKAERPPKAVKERKRKPLKPGVQKTPKAAKPAKRTRVEGDEMRAAFWRDPRIEGLLGNRRFVLLDVGAAGGIEKEWFQLLPLLEVVGFDPRWPDDIRELPGHAEEVPAGGVFPAARTLLPVALGGEKGRRTFLRTKGLKLASFLRPDAARWAEYGMRWQAEVLEEVEVETTTLDAVADELGLEFVDFIKLDTQGSELEILEGGPRTIGELAFAVRVEASLVPLYEGQPYFGDIDSHLRGLGFELFDLVRQERAHRFADGETISRAPRRGRPQLIQVDPLYFRSATSVTERLARLEERDRVRYLAGAVIACLVNHHVGHALRLAELGPAAIGTSAAQEIRELVDRYPAQGQ